MHKVQKKLDFNNLLIKLQKPIVLFMFFAIVAVFAYSLIYMTPFFGLYKADTTLLNKYLTQYGLEYDMFDKAAHVLRNDRVIGIDIRYFTIFNRWMFSFSFIGILVTCLLFVYFSQKRKRYYITNFVSFGIVAGFDFYVAFSMIANLAFWKKYVAGLNYTAINAYQSSMNLDETLVNYYSPATFDWVFMVGYIVAAVLIIAAVSGIALAVAKFIYQLKHEAIDTSEVKINE